MSRANFAPAALVLILALAVFAAEPAGEAAALVEKLGDARFRVREAAMLKLIKIGKPAVPALRAALNANDLEVKMRARQALLAIQTSLEYLLDELKSGDARARIEAADALGALGAKAKPAIAVLVKLLDGKDEPLKEAAASALAALDPENKALEKVIPAKAHCGGRYAKLLRKIHVPQDRNSYGDYHEFGHYQATDWQGHKNIPAGYWVYVFPNWYIWGEVKGLPAAPLVPQAPR
jgi:hypothetical protein